MNTGVAFTLVCIVLTVATFESSLAVTEVRVGRNSHNQRFGSNARTAIQTWVTQTFVNITRTSFATPANRTNTLEFMWWYAEFYIHLTPAISIAGIGAVGVAVRNPPVVARQQT